MLFWNELLYLIVYDDDLEKNKTDNLCFEIKKHMFFWEDHNENTFPLIYQC